MKATATYICIDCGREFTCADERDNHFMSDACKWRGRYDEEDCQYPKSPKLYMAIALEFALNLDADEVDLAEIDRENATPEYAGSSCCASHNHRDANMYMAPAFESVMGREIDMQNEDDLSLWGNAWDYAKMQGFAKLARLGAEDTDMSKPTSNFVASTHSLNPHVIDASRPHAEVIKGIISCIADAIEGTEEYVATLSAVHRVFQSEDVLWTLRKELPFCEWFECYENLYNAGWLIKVGE